MVSNLGKAIWSRLGHCWTCMRASFRSALLAWILAAAAIQIGAAVLTWATVGLASGLSALWLAHLAAYSIKFGIRSLRCPSISDADRTIQRRLVVGKVLKASAFATLVSTLPAVAQRINIPTACGDDNYKNSRTGYGACGQFCNSAQRGKFDCPRGTRPVYRTNGDCNCCTFSECS